MSVIHKAKLTTEHEDSEQNKPGCFVVKAISGFCFTVFWIFWFPDILPFGLFELWHVREGSWLVWIKSSWGVFVWGAGVTAIFHFTSRNDPSLNKDAERELAKGCLISIWAGVMEEICFRWLIFLDAIIAAKIFNFIFFGFLGFGLPEWLHQWLYGPVANFLSFGMLEQWLLPADRWAIAAGILASNAFFRDGHKYQGVFGWINSWYIGMYMFWLLFQYGVLACILVHFLYDLFIDLVRYLDMVVERKRGWV